MAGDFQERIDYLKLLIGTGKIEGSVRIDQVYAQYQHEGIHLKHRQGGKSHFLTDPLLSNFPRYFDRLARNLYHFEGIRKSMLENMNDLNDQAYDQAPKYFRDLAWSGEVRIKEGGRFVVKIPAPVQRLTKPQYRMKSKLWNQQFDPDADRD